MMVSPARGALVRYVLVGAILGALYAALNTLFDVMERDRPVVWLFGSLHAFVDRGIPILTGGLIGLALHYNRVRQALGRLAAARADELRMRLDGVEREQAVWVVAASTLHAAKNPLHAAGLLLDELEAAPDAQRGELLQRCRAQLERIDESLNALRRPDRARPGAVSLQLDRVLDEVVGDLGSRLSAAQVRVERDGEPAWVEGDRGYLRVVLENLITNALDGLAEQPAARTLRFSTVMSDGEVRLRVADNGVGLPAGVEPFAPFVTSKPRGSGLGLPIARALARLIGGDVTCESAGPGAAFVVHLRRAAR